jgi:hypothetical protein
VLGLILFPGYHVFKVLLFLIWGHSAVDAFHVRPGASTVFHCFHLLLCTDFATMHVGVSREIFVAQIGTRKDENSVVWLCLMYDYVIALRVAG